MKTWTSLFLLTLLVACKQPVDNRISLPEYPVAPSEPVTETYFGKTVTDEYRNLENLKDSLVLKWFEEEAEYADNIFGNISGRAELIEQLKEFDQRKSYVIRNVNITEDDQYFFLKQAAEEDVSRLFYRKSFESEDELLYDPKQFKPESGNKYVINYIQPSWDGAYLVIALSHSGAEISEMIIMDMNTRKVLPQIIDHCWPSDGGGVSWLPDNSGFFYLHYPEIDHTSERFLKDMKSVLYKIGSDPKYLDVQLSKETQPELGILPEDFPIIFLQGKEDKYLYGIVAGATAYFKGYYAEMQDLKTGKLRWKPLHREVDKVSWGHFRDDKFIFSSAKNAPNFRILSTPVSNPDFNDPSVLVEEKADEVINSFQLTSDGIYYTSTKNGVEGQLYHLENGKEAEIALPRTSGRVNISTKGPDFPDLWVSTMGWLNDFERYKYHKNSNEFIEENLTPLANFPEFDDFLVQELLVPSHDGEEVPLSIIYKKGIELNGQHPTLLLGYGSYGWPINPFFSPRWLLWVEKGGIFGVAHVRGGGEKGDQWYQAGKKTTKPNTWKDMIACTEYMIGEGYTSTDKTVIFGGSAGGILIGRAMTERPDLFAVAIAEVGVMNTFRNEQRPNGPNNAKEYGTIQDSVECMALIEMDAYLHIEEGREYPATLITTGMNDPRVIAWQPGKFAAKLQAANSSGKPIIFQVDYESGHGIDDTKSKFYEQTANTLSFALWQTGHPEYILKDSN